MASIDELLQKIAEAVYGKDVRSSIHDGIKLCYEEGQTAKTSAASSATDAASAKTEAEDFISTVQEKLDKGELTGKGLTILGYYDTLEALQAAVTNPSAGDCYGVGTAIPYTIYVYDGVNAVWKDNGTMGTEGALPKGGSAGQILVKATGSDYDCTWGGIPVTSVNGLTGAVTLDVPPRISGKNESYAVVTSFTPAAGSSTTLSNFTVASTGVYYVSFTVNLTTTITDRVFIVFGSHRACFPVNTPYPTATVSMLMRCEAGTQYPLTFYTSYLETFTYESVQWDWVRLADG